MASLAAAALLAALLASDAAAHRLRLFVTVEGRQFHGHAYYSGGGPAARAEVEVRDSDGTAARTVVTDDEGAFTLEAMGDFDHLFLIDTGDGHRAEFLVPVSDFAALPRAPADATLETEPAPEAEAESAGGTDISIGAIERAIARQVRPLREQLDAYEDQVRFRDILGGIGYIAGILGLIAYWKARQRSRRD